MCELHEQYGNQKRRQDISKQLTRNSICHSMKWKIKEMLQLFDQADSDSMKLLCLRCVEKLMLEENMSN